MMQRLVNQSLLVFGAFLFAIESVCHAPSIRSRAVQSRTSFAPDLEVLLSHSALPGE